MWTRLLLTIPAAWSLALAWLSPASSSLKNIKIWNFCIQKYLDNMNILRKFPQAKQVRTKYHKFPFWIIPKLINDISRLRVEKPIEICEDLLWHPNIWQNNQGQSSKVCGHVVSNWWHHGTSHWILHHQWSGDHIFSYKDCF